MTPAHRPHDISDQVWELLRPHLPAGAGKRGRPAQDNRLFFEHGVLESADWGTVAGPAAPTRGDEKTNSDP